MSALLGDDVERDAEAIIAWNAAHAGRHVIDCVEARVSTADAIAATAQALPNAITLYSEIPLDGMDRFVDELARTGVRAKIRTGGVTPDVFPRSEDVSRFLGVCARNAVAFKATAGLHHPVRGDYRLTYDANAQWGAMFGFLNLFLGAAFVRSGMSQPTLAALLEEREPSALHFTNRDVTWREHSISLDAIIETRRTFAIAFGSCSLREPLDDLHRLRLL